MRPMLCLLAILCCVLHARTSPAGSRATINSDQVLVIDGKKVFPIGFTMPPPPDGKTPEGRNAIRQLADAGATFMRTGAQGGPWDEATLKREKQYLDAAAKYGLYCMPYLRELARVSSLKEEEQLRRLLARFKDHRGLGAWKGDDEPEWAKAKLPPLLRARDIVREMDPHHPIVIIQAPRGTPESLRPYNEAGDVLGCDIYPISYPPGVHSLLTNKTLSLVGDHTRIMMETAEGRMPVWMVLQIAWSGVIKPGKTLRFPTFPEERFMTYQAIINGARGLVYFGGNLEPGLNPADRKLGWNWTFWRRVLRPVIEEIGSRSPLYPVLLAPNSGIQLQVSGADGIETLVRRVGDELFVLACKAEPGTQQAQFSGLPPEARGGEVLYESPRTVQAANGSFKDWFAPYEVHVYRFQLGASPGPGSTTR